MLKNEKYRLAYFIIGFIVVVIGFLLKSFYRPFASSIECFDFGFANSSPSLFYVVGFSLLLSFNKQFKVVPWILIVTTASIVYEYYQSFGNQSLDLSDTIYSIVGGVFAFLIHSLLKIQTSKAK